MRKLLILGANTESIPIVLKAKQLGIFVCVTDFNPDAPAKKFADKAFNIDGFDIINLKKLCNEESIDGIIVGVADRLIKPYFLLCNELGKPCYVNNNTADIFTDKELFNEYCLKYDIPVIPQLLISNSPNFDELNKIDYPVFVKPPDSNSGKGMSIVNCPEEFGKAIEKAKSFSKSKRFLVDRYMNCDDMFVYFTFTNGKFLLSATADRFTSNEQQNFSKVCLGGIYPSKYTDIFIDQYLEKFSNLFRDLGVENGVLMVSAFVEDDKFYFYDPGFRLQGEAPNNIIKAHCNFDQIEFLINVALNSNYKNIEDLNDPHLNKAYGASIWFLLKMGKIGFIDGLDFLENNPKVINKLQRFYVGDNITQDMIGTEGQVFMRVYIIDDDLEKLKETIQNIQNSLIVLDENNQNMLLNGFTTKTYK